MAAAIAEELARRFVCPKCKAAGGTVRTVNANPMTFAAALFRLPGSVLFAVSCKRCGFTELFDADTLNKNRNGGTIFDTIYGPQSPS